MRSVGGSRSSGTSSTTSGVRRTVRRRTAVLAGRTPPTASATPPRASLLAPTDPPRSARPDVPWDRTVVYEAHLRGLTMRHPDVPEELRGTWAGLGAPGRRGAPAWVSASPRSSCSRCSRCGDEPALVQRRDARTTGVTTTWPSSHPSRGTPPRPRARPGRQRWPRRSSVAVDALHEAGLEVWLDVVYNHTCEGGGRRAARCPAAGSTTPSYYRHGRRHGRRPRRHRLRQHRSTSRHPRVVAAGPGLAAALGADRTGSTASGSTSPPRWLAATRAAAPTPTSPTTRSWSPPAPTRCCRRSSWSPSPGTSGRTAGARVSSRRRSRSGTTGSATASGRSGWPTPRTRWGPRTGTSAPTCATSPPASPGRRTCFTPTASGGPGAPGPHWRPSPTSPRTTGSPLPTRPPSSPSTTRRTGRATPTGTVTTGPSTTASRARPDVDAATAAARRRSLRADLLGTLLLATGVPMLTAGDETGRTQGGNNNAYCIDDATTWLDWSWWRPPEKGTRAIGPPPRATPLAVVTR